MSKSRQTQAVLHTQPPEQKKPKLERAFSPKVRTGCLTCKTRHKKCDEEKPICRRCREASVKCDGYLAPTKTPKGTVVGKRKSALEQVEVPDPTHQRVGNAYYHHGTEVEAQFLHHFFHYTCEELSTKPESSNIWLSHILPLAHACEPVSHAMTAVGAAHRLFVARSLSAPGWEELIPVTLRQYNKAISYIMPWMSCESVFSTQCTLVCCLLFTCFENFIGRYAESIRHIGAGNRLLSSKILTNSPAHDVTRELAAVFARLAVEASIFMERPVVSSIHHCYGMREDEIERPVQPFKDLAEASYELCALDMDAMSMLHFEQRSLSPNSDTQSISQSPSKSLDENGSSFSGSLKERFMRWDDRFKVTEKVTSSFSQTTPELRHLKVQRHFWMLAGDWLPGNNAALSSESLSGFLDELEIAAWPFTALNKPTFSLDGNLISSLSFVVSFSVDADIRSRALRLLRSLNRRESMWDSRDVANLHDATLSLEDSEVWYRRKMDGGLPQYVTELSRVTPYLSSENGILLSKIDN